MLQNHPKYREATYTQMLERVNKEISANSEKVGKVLERARQRIRAKEAKRPLHADYMQKVRQYLQEGLTRGELFDRITLKSKKKKHREGAGCKDNRNAYKKAKAQGKLLLSKVKKNLKKFQQRKKAGKKKGLNFDEADEFKVGPMVGKTVRVIADLGELANRIGELMALIRKPMLCYEKTAFCASSVCSTSSAYLQAQGARRGV